MSASEARRERRRLATLAGAGSPLASAVIDFSRDERLAQDARKVDQYYRFYWSKILGEALTRIKWSGLPDEVDTRYLELLLFLRGQATITHVSGDVLAQMSAPTASWDNQMNYTQWASIGAVGGYLGDRTPSNAVMIWDNDARFVTAGVIEPLCSDLAQALVTASSNLMQQRVGVFFTASRSNQADAKRLARMIGLGEVGAVKVDEVGGTVGVDVVNPNVPDHTQTAFKARTEFMNEVHSFLGTDFLPMEKESGLQEHEASVGHDVIMRQRELFLAPRRRAAQQMNELFGWSVSVSWNSSDEDNDGDTSERDDDASNADNE